MELKLNGRIWVETEGGPTLGPGRIELLERIQQSGSIRQAAMQMGMSYRQAWQLIDHMNTHLKAPVVISHRGGKGGGWAEVTPAGLEVIQEFKLLYQKFHEFLAQTGLGLHF
ncbi:LysR family transcriptional regulator [Mucilaginibacter robiniae]|uniref:LysR family transcriptional regulator n=1 Tax=Mucilaginibacter robiniae TaxID=2728022 RepID=A0A7L5DVT1_9SPHI|nr:winged helix-turn-helix domain-containing protein [Mucilaginibacter robiniae]QJD95200.1 LysR family transcriptional regulator [Mucilaginibacter robiniae]